MSISWEQAIVAQIVDKKQGYNQSGLKKYEIYDTTTGRVIMALVGKPLTLSNLNRMKKVNPSLSYREVVQC